MLTARERAPTAAGSPSSTVAWVAQRDLPVSRADSRGWNHRLTRAPSQVQQDSVSRQFPEPSRIRSSIMLYNVAGASWAWGRRREELLACRRDVLCCPGAPLPFLGTTTSACSFSQGQLSRGLQLMLLCCSWHTSGAEQRVWVCIPAMCDSGLAVGCEKLELGSSCLNVSQGEKGMLEQGGEMLWKNTDCGSICVY